MRDDLGPVPEPHADRHGRLAQLVGKPLVLEEFGLVRDNAETQRGSSVSYRDRLLRKVYAEIDRTGEYPPRVLDGLRRHLFNDVLWPDFRRLHLLQAIADFQKRERRYGGITPA